MRPLVRCILPAVALAALPASHSAVPGAAPVLAAVAKAANAQDRAAAARFTVGNRTEVFSWIPEAGGLTIHGFFQPNPWKSAILEPPFTNGGPVAVFHTWHAPESDGDHIHPLVKTPAGWRLKAEISERDTQGYRITHHNLAIRIVPSRKQAVIRDAFVVVPYGKPQPVAYIRISDDFQVTSLKSSGRAVPFRQAGGVVAVRMPKAGAIRFEMLYLGRVDHKSLSAITPDLAVLCAYYYPTLGRLPSTADVAITVPKAWSAVTQGELVGTRTVGAEKEYRFHNALPVNYFSLDAAPYRITTRKVAGHTLYAYLLKSRAGFADQLLDSVAEALPYFERRFGPYPYSRYSVVDGGAIMGFVALEGYSMATYGTITLMPNVLAHEVAHTWWGGVVPNTYLRSWWNESFARYSDDAYSRMRNHISEEHPSDKPWWPPYASVDEAPLSTARDADSINSIAYEKGRVVLRLLEDQLGQPAFDNCLRDFVRKQKSALDTDWPDFQRVVDRVSAGNWDWFFNQWVRRPGWPEVSLQNVRADRTPEGQWHITAQIVQPGQPYVLDVPIRLSGVAVDDRPATAERPAWQDASVRVVDSPMPFEFTLQYLPARLEIDPGFDLPRKFGVEDIAVFDKFGNTILQHSREEPGPSPFGGM